MGDFDALINKRVALPGFWIKACIVLDTGSRMTDVTDGLLRFACGESRNDGRMLKNNGVRVDKRELLVLKFAINYEIHVRSN